LTKKIKILLVEDHAVVRAGVRLLLNAQPDMEVVGELDNGQDLLKRVEQLRPDVVVMDISMPGVNGLEAARQLSTTHQKQGILILTMHDNEEYFFQAIKAGASGYIPKSAPETELLAAVRSVAVGKVYLHSSVAHLLVNDYLEKVKSDDDHSGIGKLTDREREIMLLIIKGSTNREIAERLTISIHTVNNHRANLMEKLGVHNQVELIKYAIKKGIIQLD
jgi:two-component system response regulator NreC